MEDNKKNIRFGRQSFGSISILSSLFLAIIAVVGVVTFGFKNSYAIPDVNSYLPEKFKTAEIKKTLKSDTDFYVSEYFTDGGIQVFCLGHMVDFKEGIEYSRGNAIEDYGLLYLMANIYPNKAFGNYDKDLQTWLSQTAIWLYLYRVTDLDNDGQLNGNVAENSEHYISPVELDSIQKARGVIDIDDDSLTFHTLNTKTGGVSVGNVTSEDPLLYTAIDGLVNEAIANRKTPNKALTIDFDDQISVTQDEKYYQTSAIAVTGTPSDNFNGYEVKISSAPDGTFVVNANGEKIEDLTNMKASDKFYFRVPVDKVTEEKKSIKFTVTGSFKTYEGYYYVAENAQTITGIGTVNNNLNKGAEIQLNYTPDVPDTGMSAAQTVYFVGLIILLSGVGIIYANVKPEESK